MISSIQTLVEEVLKYSQDVDHVHGIGELVQKSIEAKSDLINTVLGGKLIRDCGPVEFTLGESERHNRLAEFIDSIECNYCNSALARFIYDNESDFFANRLSEDYMEPLTGVKVPKSMKIVKAFKLFEDNKEMLKKLQEEASMIIQETRVQGNLYLSVHPLDFLSLSENTCNWRSCHSLDGEYRAGNLSYMCDDCTLICYLAHPGTQQKLPNFPSSVPWNSKKWRMLIFFSIDRDAMFAGRQYPFFSKDALNQVRINILDHDRGHWTRWSDTSINSLNDYHLECRHYLVQGRLFPIDKMVEDVRCSKHFNDLLYSSIYIPYLCYEHYLEGTPRFLIGSKSRCVRCGCSLDYESSDTMLCEECQYDNTGNADYFYCDCCGAKTARDRGIRLTSTEDLICEHCYENTSTCEVCGDQCYNTNMIYSRERQRWECCWCRYTEEENDNGER